MSWTSEMATRSSYFSLPVLLLDKFVQRELKQGISDSLCETKVFHQARHIKLLVAIHDVRELQAHY